MRTSKLTIQKRIFLLKSESTCISTFTSIEALMSYAMRHGGEYVEYVSPETLMAWEMSSDELHRTKNVEDAILFVKRTGRKEFTIIDTISPIELLNLEEEVVKTHYEIQEVKLWEVK